MSLKIEKPEDLELIAKYMTKAVKQPRNGFKNHDSWMDLKDLIAHFENDNGFDYKVRRQIWEDFGGFEMKKTKDNILKLLEEIVAANKTKILKETIYLLHGDNAVNFYKEYGVDTCIKQGFNHVSCVPFDKNTPIETIIQRVLNGVAGSLDSCIITKAEYDKIIKATK